MRVSSFSSEFQIFFLTYRIRELLAEEVGDELRDWRAAHRSGQQNGTVQDGLVVEKGTENSGFLSFMLFLIYKLFKNRFYF